MAKGLLLGSITSGPADLLSFDNLGAGNVALKVRTDILYLDIKLAIEHAGLSTSGDLQFTYLDRDQYPFTAVDLVTALKAAGHLHVPR